MTKHIFLIQGAGAGAYEVDKLLATSLSHSLGLQYEVHYPALPHEEDASYEEWKDHLEKESKKDGGFRLCVDYRALNKQTIKN